MHLLEINLKGLFAAGEGEEEEAVDDVEGGENEAPARGEAAGKQQHSEHNEAANEAHNAANEQEFILQFLIPQI